VQQQQQLMQQVQARHQPPFSGENKVFPHY